MDDVTWLPIPEASNYEASSDGRVRSVPRTLQRSDGMFVRREGKLLGQFLRGAGYLYVDINYDDGKRRSPGVHRLVCRTFQGPPPASDMVVRHLNGDPADNRVENLKWGTRSENALDTVKHGRNVQAAKTHCVNGHEFNESNTGRQGRRRSRACRKCAAIRVAEYRKRCSANPLAADDPRHGTITGYTRGCRCRPCLQAKNNYHRQMRRRQKEAAAQVQYSLFEAA